MLWKMRSTAGNGFFGTWISVLGLLACDALVGCGGGSVGAGGSGGSIDLGGSGGFGGSGADANCPAGSIYCSEFEDDNWLMSTTHRGNCLNYTSYWTSYTPNTGLTTAEKYAGSSAIYYQNGPTISSYDGEVGHGPDGYLFSFPDYAAYDSLYIRWYRKYESGYQFGSPVDYGGPWYGAAGESKSNAIYGLGPDDYCTAFGAGQRPTGYDFFSCQMVADELPDDVDHATGDLDPVLKHLAEPKLYCYHLDQAGNYGDHWGWAESAAPDAPHIQLAGGQWYKFEMLIKANNAPDADGEARLWINDQEIIRKTGIRFRLSNDVKLKTFTLSAWFGGDSIAPKNQKVFDDDVAISTSLLP